MEEVVSVMIGIASARYTYDADGWRARSSFYMTRCGRGVRRPVERREQEERLVDEK